MSYDHLAPLPHSPLLLEASAGTGKTWTIAALTARYVAEEGISMDQILLITFTEKAARELRGRVFERLHTSERHLTAQLEEGIDPDDTLSAHLCLADAGIRRDRLRAALADFDRATVSTIHSFCRSMLRELGVLGDWDVAEEVLTRPRTLIDQCATDVYLSTFADSDEAPFTPRDALQVARAACESPLPLSPQGSERGEFAEAVRTRFAARKRILGMVTFDDMPGRLQQVLASADIGRSATAALARRFRLVMVDEFQDTDPIQWDLVRRAFMAPDRSTILIGDPKQSIYGFRNADLASYLEAARQTRRETLETNRRSDGPLVAAVTELFGNTELGDASIRVTPVDTEHGSRFTMAGAPQRLLIRRARERSLGEAPDIAIANDVVALTHRLLGEAKIGRRALRATDVAVLVRNGDTGRQLVDALLAAGLPATFSGAGDLFTSRAGRDWSHLLHAMADPRRSPVVMAACTDLIGLGPAGLVEEGGEASERAFWLIRKLARAFDDGGIPAVVACLEARAGLRSRVLAVADGERRLSDLLQVAEILAACDTRDLQSLIDRLGDGAAEGPQPSPEAEGRLASDADAVRVMTLHAAKGLEFGVVLLPEVSNLTTHPGRPFPYMHAGSRWLHVGGKLDHRDPTRTEFERQCRDEELRLLYVGLTRARHLAIAWHVEGRKSGGGPLTALLARDRASGRLAQSYGRIPDAPALDASLIGITSFDTPLGPPTPRPAPQGPPLRVATFGRSIDQTWRRTSYSGLTAGLHEAAPPGTSDEPETDLDVTSPGAGATRSPMAGLGAGTRFGTLVHAALERLNWRPEHLGASAVQVCVELAPVHGLTDTEAGELASALVAACTTPLGALAPGTSLSGFPLSRRLSELDFDLPLADAGTARTLADLASLMSAHLDPTDPLAAYPDHLAGSSSAVQTMNGMLTGSIDVVLQRDDGRFVVVDYKTNRFPTGHGEELVVEQYARDPMARAMIAAHYPLQALLYCVALHRFLGWRLPSYDAERHLGGVGYLFVRGMAGPLTPVIDGVTCGVFTWFPPTPLVTAASDLLAGRR